MKHSLSYIKTLATAQTLLRSKSTETAQIKKVLGLIGKALEVDRASLFKISDNGTLLEPLVLWADEGIARRENTPLVIENLDDLAMTTSRALAEPIYKGQKLAGMLLLETNDTHHVFDADAKEFSRNAAIILAPGLDTKIEPPSPPKLSRPDGVTEPDLAEDLNILIVEDDEANLFMIRKFIERFGAIPHAARNGQDAVRICKETKFDVILMDLTMPKLDGFDATREIVTGENLNRNTPIIAVTADVTDGIERRCKKIGMQHYIAKPIRRDTIIRALTDLTDKTPKTS